MMVQLTVKFEKQQRENSFNEFLSKTLKFQQLTEEEIPCSVSFVQLHLNFPTNIISGTRIDDYERN